MTEFEVLIFLEHLAHRINHDMQLGLSVPAMRRVAMRVMQADPEGAEALHDSLGRALVGERTLH